MQGGSYEIFKITKAVGVDWVSVGSKVQILVGSIGDKSRLHSQQGF
jgi:hypothetical protein